MPAIIINELSAIGQARTGHEADSIMRSLAETLRTLGLIQCGSSTHTHSSIFNQKLSEKQTIHGWLVAQVRDREIQTIRVLLLRLFRKGPHIDILLTNVSHACYRTIENQSIDHSGTALAGAAHLNAWLVSFSNCPRFPSGSLVVNYREGQRSFEQIDISHFVNADDARRIRRIYEPHPKHGTIPTSGIVGTPMDLSDAEAQRVLDNCISIPNEKRVCAIHAGRIYVFHPHRAEVNLYHGFPVEVMELQRKLPEHYRYLLSAGMLPA